MSTSEKDLEKKKLAAFVYALGWTRGVLSDVLDGDFSREQVQRIYDATASKHIAVSIGLTESDLAVDMHQLTDQEKHRLQGYDTA